MEETSEQLYFVRHVGFNMPKNKLQGSIQTLICDNYSGSLVSGRNALLKELEEKVLELNTQYSRCKPESVRANFDGSYANQHGTFSIYRRCH
jgi:hypothetical protein